MEILKEKTILINTQGLSKEIVLKFVKHLESLGFRNVGSIKDYDEFFESLEVREAQLREKARKVVGDRPADFGPGLILESNYRGEEFAYKYCNLTKEGLEFLSRLTGKKTTNYPVKTVTIAEFFNL